MSTTASISFVESTHDAELVADFFNEVWMGTDDVAPVDIILAAVHVGAYAAFAKLDDKVVAASFGFLGTYGELQILHSHVTASTFRGLGYELKVHQKAWAEARGLDAITWTFDPLVRRNCVFNFEKLGAVAVEYLENFYGTMIDAINRGEDSDRLFLVWPLSLAAQNFVGQSSESQSEFVLPEDIEALRVSDPAAASQHRRQLRISLQQALARGGRIRRMNSDRTALLLEE